MSDAFKDRLRKWRGRLLQKEAAEKLEVTLSAYQKWEYGSRKPKALTLCEIERRMTEIQNPQ